MTQALPVFFATLCAAALLAALYAIFRSLRAALSGEAQTLDPSMLVTEERSALLREKAVLLASLRDLALDHEAGKTSDEDLAHSEKRLRARAKAVLRALDEEIAPFRAQAESMLALPPAASADTEEEPLPAKLAESEAEADAPAEETKPPTDPTCFACGTKNDADAAFCKKCGKPMEASS
jgi:hypothetical protein